MTIEQQRELIATKVMGWHLSVDRYSWLDNDGHWMASYNLGDGATEWRPDQSPDDIHEIESRFTEERWDKYLTILNANYLASVGYNHHLARWLREADATILFTAIIQMIEEEGK